MWDPRMSTDTKPGATAALLDWIWSPLLEDVHNLNKCQTLIHNWLSTSPKLQLLCGVPSLQWSVSIEIGLRKVLYW